MDGRGAGSYEDKLERLDKCVRFDKVDRVPIGVASLYFPAKHAGISYEEMYYDQEKYLSPPRSLPGILTGTRYVFCVLLNRSPWACPWQARTRQRRSTLPSPPFWAEALPTTY
jgi:hypothetical protein